MTLEQAMNQALAEHLAGNLDQAETIYRRIILAAPQWPGAHVNLAEALRAGGRLSEAESSLRNALALDSTDAVAWSNLGLVLRGLNRVSEAEAACRRAVSLNPDSAPAHQNLGNVLGDKGDVDDAVEECRRAVELSPQNADALADLAAAHVERADSVAALNCYQHALRLRPDDATIHLNYAQLLLQSGDFERGWAEYEWRWRSSAFTTPRREFSAPRWDGLPAPDRTILVHAEQGFGDMIMFARYFSLVAKRARRVILECYEALAPLLKTVEGVSEIVISGQPLPAFDLHAPLLSLPRLLRESPPAPPYVSVDHVRAPSWQERLHDVSRPRIGVAWCGSRTQIADKRSIPVDQFCRILATTRGSFISLQKDLIPEESDALSRARVHDFAQHLHDFADTAALIGELDLVVSIDSSVAHLAGAMGKPVWVMLAYSPDWRWMLGREDSMWYPTARLLRQSRPRDWSGLSDRVARALADLVF
ncbi:MAG: tetratricopeptide repeat protein [Tepidisphaeraceae bacterium]